MRGRAQGGSVPIRAENKRRYPTDWPAISQAVKERAGWRCECVGECGTDHGGHGDHGGRCEERHRVPARCFRGRVILTVAHLDHRPENSAPENLRAMCQACHLRYDRDLHAETRRWTRDHGVAPVQWTGLRATQQPVRIRAG